ncbi:hypothetical protein SAMN05443270_4614 [Lacrimispora sphenoides]|uniref:hypothetical protein n=1 Tax=Lacrimispora sphenoides TaxID=29370 RepID=UPI0008ACA470|nr:hypothetical protein [Lacrimispora sphenoides]SEU28775.1 hypothetical protein SAMN05443270_4614 [Lacrimispora sphenoides]
MNKNINRNPSTPYESTFKCQLCGEKFNGFSTNMVTDEDIMEYPLKDIRKHRCKDGSVGVALLIGYKYVKQ